MEDWDAEAKAQPEPTFTLPSLTPSQQQRPKQFFLWYLKTVHGRETASKVRTELNYLKRTEGNCHQWKEEALRKAIEKIDNLPENLLRHEIGTRLVDLIKTGNHRACAD